MPYAILFPLLQQTNTRTINKPEQGKCLRIPEVESLDHQWQNELVLLHYVMIFAPCS